MSRHLLLILAALLLLASACARQARPTRERERAFRPQRGIASYYGPGLHGNRTANGERFNKNAFTAAHRTLPFDTCVRVQNLGNGRQVKVRVNDRGPYAKGRLIDVSEAAARRLGFRDKGVARVELRPCE